MLAEAFNHMSEDIQRTQAESDLRAQQQAALAELGQNALAGMSVPTCGSVVTLLSHFLNVEYTKILELTPIDQAAARRGRGLRRAPLATLSWT